MTLSQETYKGQSVVARLDKARTNWDNLSEIDRDLIASNAIMAFILSPEVSAVERVETETEVLFLKR